MRTRPDRKGQAQLIVAIVALLLSVLTGVDGGAASPPSLAIADFTFSDSSGEVRDQRAEHEARLRAFADRLRTDLAAGGRLRLVDIPCDSPPCAADMGRQAERARKAGAAFVLFGSIHKMSTLVLSVPVRVIDVSRDKVMFERLHSFRGDTDEAWQRAAGFLARELTAELAGKR